MADTNSTNNSTLVSFDLSKAWVKGKLALAKRLKVAGKTAKETAKAGEVEYFFPMPFTAPVNDKGEYENPSLAFAHSALVSAIQTLAKGAFDISGDTPDSLAIVPVAGKSVPASWEDLETTGRTRYFEELKLLSAWRVGFAAFLGQIGKSAKQTDNACEAFQLASAEKMASNRFLADDAKRAVIGSLVDQYHAALDAETMESLAPAIKIVSRAFEAAATLGDDDEGEDL